MELLRFEVRKTGKTRVNGEILIIESIHINSASPSSIWHGVMSTVSQIADQQARLPNKCTVEEAGSNCWYDLTDGCMD